MRRRMRRGRYYNSNGDNKRHSLGILLTDFKFHNRQTEVISPKTIKDIEEKITEENPIYWTNREFFKSNVCFKFFIDVYDSDDAKSKEVKEKSIQIIELKQPLSMTVSEFSKIKHIYHSIFPFSFILNDEQKKFLEKQDFSYHNPNFNKKKMPLFNTWEEFIDYIIVNNLIRFVYSYYDEFFTYMKTAFDYKMPTREKEYVIYDRNSNGYIYIYHILKVLERRIDEKNYRIVLGRKAINSYSSDSFCLIIPEDSPYYTLMDEDRFFFSKNGEKNSKFYFLDTGLIDTTPKKIIIQKAVMKLILDNIDTVLGQNLIVNNRVWNFYYSRYALANNSKDDVLSEFAIKYIQVLNKGKPIKIGFLKITKKSIEIDEQDFKLEFEEGFIDIREHLDKLRTIATDNDMRYNFNELYEKILHCSKLNVISRFETSTNAYKDFEGASFVFNGMKIAVTKDKNRIFINEIFCRIVDIFEILKRVICHNSLEEFNKYVKDVSYIGHEWKVMIGNGVQIDLSNPFTSIMRKVNKTANEKTRLRFSFIWDAEKRSKIYLVVNDNKFLINHKGKFKHRFYAPSLNLSMRALKGFLTECIYGLKEDDILQIVDEAIKEGKIIQARALELVENTIKDIKAQEVTINIKGSVKKGYKFIGRVSGSEYFVDMGDLSVFKKVSGQWNRRCVVNDYNKNRIFEDWLANRLVNVYNEPAYIYTLHNI